MDDQLDFVVEDKSRRGGVSIAVVVSLVVHILFGIYVVRNYHPISQADATAPIRHYIELIRQNPQQFTEAPGPKVGSAPLNSPYSDANRHASMPKPTGDKPTLRPGEGGFYVPSSPSGNEGSPRAGQAAAAESELSAANAANSGGSTFAYHPPTKAAASNGVDWRSAIREVGKIASLGTGQQGIDLGNPGGEKGFAESGPLSFETQWYDWGEYAQSMVSRIRVNWYNNMPQLIQTGLKGVVTIRFTIQRDGRITNIVTLSTSSVPPYDFAAKKAIELSTPLNPLPKDFPNASERVTCMFFYNQEPPTH